jgi:hypothetical protein
MLASAAASAAASNTAGMDVSAGDAVRLMAEQAGKPTVPFLLSDGGAHRGHVAFHGDQVIRHAFTDAHPRR